MNLLCASARLALLLAACLSSSEGVQVATPAQADLQISEDLGPDVGVGAGADLNVNALNDTLGLKNEVIALRFTLTGEGCLQATNSWLKLINYKQNTTTQVLYFYGVKNGATGYNEVTSTAGTDTDNNWPENGTAFSTTPGLEYDVSITTTGVRLDRVTDLGTTYPSTGNHNNAKGAELIFSNTKLKEFLVNHPDRVVTILMVADLPISNGQKRFASKESTQLDTDPVDTVPVGTYAPVLNLMVDSFSITNITLGSGTGQITLTWTSEPDQVFRITHSQSLNDGFPGVAASDIPASAGTSTTLTIPNPQPGAQRLFLRVERP